MKVSELITQLQKLDPNALVLLRSRVIKGFLDEARDAQEIRYRQAQHTRHYYNGKYEQVQEAQGLDLTIVEGVLIW